jgi:N-acetylmuramoyl-L-alanine amidase
MDWEEMAMKVKSHGRIQKRRIVLLILAVAVVLGIHPVYEGMTAMVHQIIAADTILIDPGHGGMDGGASSANGTTEKDINLAIALYIKELAEADGWHVVLTRQKDEGLGGKGNGTIRSQKTADLIARREMIKEVKPVVAVSIHLNSFKQDSSVRGAQAFYPSGPAEQTVLDESKRLAEVIQEKLISGMADGNDREALVKRDVLMFKNPTVPMVIIECGFLSNPEEAKLLEQEEYQRKLAEFIYDGIRSYTGKEPQKPVESIDSRG